jgi:CAAX prenyl protease-like protein
MSRVAPARTPSSSDHGWWPYLLPYLGFMLSGEIGGRLPESWAPAMLVVGPAVPAALIYYFYRQGRYPELRDFGPHAGRLWQDVLVGLALTVVWMAPLLLGVDVFLGEHVWGAFGPPEPGSGFDRQQWGEGMEPLVLAIRFAGFACVTPLFEELFIRSFVMRYAEVFDSGEDFRRVPIAHYTRKSFWVATVVFTAAHLPWEWIVAVPWVVLSSWWFYRRGHLGAVIAVHAVTNAAILLFVLAMGGELTLGGRTIDLWIFV